MDWNNHRAQSASFKVARNDVVGRHFIATRDLQPGEEVLRDAPLVTGPPWVTDCLVCVTCYRVLQGDSPGFRYCPHCGWPVCSQKCADSDIHFPECQLTVNNCDGGKVDISTLLQIHPVYHSLIILRCLLLRDSNPKVWEKLQKLESHCTKRLITGHYEKDRKTVARFLLSYFHLDNDFTEDDVLKLCGVVQVNNYLVRLTEPYFLAVYDVASFIEHSCVPNCAKVFNAKGELIIKTACHVSKDDHLSICYTDATCGTHLRREKLLDELLACRCRRCSDPTELQSFFSALRCSHRGCSGWMLPEHPILEDVNNNSGSQENFWVCSSCAAQIPSNEVAHVLNTMSQAAEKLDKTDLQACEKFLADQAPVVHPDHYLLLSARLTVAGRPLNGVSDKELTEIQTELNQLLRLSDLILPAENRIRGMVLYQLSSASIETELRRMRCGDISLEDLKNNLKESKQLLQKAVDVLHDQPDVVPEGKIGKLAEKRLQSFDSLLEKLSDDATVQHSLLPESPLQVTSLAN